MIKKLLNRYGVLMTTTVLSVLCIFVSLLITATIWQLAGLPNLHFVLLVAFLCPTFIAPPVILSLGRLTENLQNSQNEVAQVNSALQKSEEQYQFLCESATDLILVLAPDGKILYVNTSWREKFGFPKDEPVSLKFIELVEPGCRERFADIFEQVLVGGRVENIEFSFITRSGRGLILQGNANCEYERGIPVVVQCIFRDVTVQRKLEEDLLRVQKNSSLAIMAGGIAHDFNNYLLVINGNIELAKNTADDRESSAKYLTQAETVSHKAQELTRQLLTFSRERGPETKPTSISEIIRETASFARNPSNISYDFHLAEDLWLVEIDEGQFSQVFHNLIINAVQAMQSGGTITFGGENVDVPIDTPLPLSEGRYVKIFVADQGCGIAEDALKVIFDPYYSSKADGHGLGLAVTYSVIKNHNGYIDVDSTIGEGTTFNLFVPARPAAP